MKSNFLSKVEIKSMIDGITTPRKTPVLLDLWSGSWIYKGRNKRQANKIIRKYKDDFIRSGMGSDPIFKREAVKDGEGIDSHFLLADMEKIDAYVADFHSPQKTKMYFEKGKKYNIFVLWGCLFENHWAVRGMENALTDYYLYPDEVHKLFRGFTDCIKGLIKRAKAEGDCDGFFVSDDLGTQSNTFFSPEIFEEFYYPYYKEMIDTAHECNMHFWLHTCGNVSGFMDFFVKLKLDVLHPIQKYSMDEVAIFDKYKDKICFLYGFDVQRTIPFGTAKDVSVEVKRVASIFSKAIGRFIFTAGNVIGKDCPIDSFCALRITAHEYNPYREYEK